MCAFFSIQIRRGVKKFWLQAPWSQNWCLVPKGAAMLPFWNHILANLGLFIHVHSWILWYVCCMYLGTKGGFFLTCVFCDLPPCRFVGNLPLRTLPCVPTLILRVEVSFSPNFRLCVHTCCHIIATSPQTICHHHREASHVHHMTSYLQITTDHLPSPPGRLATSTISLHIVDPLYPKHSSPPLNSYVHHG